MVWWKLKDLRQPNKQMKSSHSTTKSARRSIAIPDRSQFLFTASSGKRCMYDRLALLLIAFGLGSEF
jgi:hypothetical protein